MIKQVSKWTTDVFFCKKDSYLRFDFFFWIMFFLNFFYCAAKHQSNWCWFIHFKSIFDENQLLNCAVKWLSLQFNIISQLMYKCLFNWRHISTLTSVCVYVLLPERCSKHVLQGWMTSQNTACWHWVHMSVLTGYKHYESQQHS